MGLIHYLKHCARYDNQEGDGDGNDDLDEEEDDEEKGALRSGMNAPPARSNVLRRSATRM